MYQIVSYYQENNELVTTFKLNSRYLWDDHVSYTRNIIFSILSNMPDVDSITTRLLANQEDIGTFISPYYSTTQVYGFVDLLKKHIAIAADVISGVEGSEQQWRMNGTDIVNYMHNMNRLYWPKSVISPLWTKHLDLTIEQVNYRNSSMWDEDIKAYDENHKCMSEFADIMSNGIIYQHLDMFCPYMIGNTK